MSSFSYGIHTKKHIGVWLRLSNNPDLIKMLNTNKNKRFFDIIHRIVVHLYDKKTNEVWLEVWCDNLIDTIRQKDRCNVFYVKLPVNENWSCDGDFGNGKNLNNLCFIKNYCLFKINIYLCIYN
jgi:hypothetical protein